jgi:hypothetical protein
MWFTNTEYKTLWNYFYTNRWNLDESVKLQNKIFYKKKSNGLMVLSDN